MMEHFLYSDDGVNVLLFHAVNNIQASWFQQAAQIGSAVGKHTLFPLWLLIVALWAKKSGKDLKQIVAPLVITYIGYVVWVSGLKHFLHMPRPFAVLPPGSFFVTESTRMTEDPFVSLPSGHAAFSMMLLVALWPLLNRCGRGVGILLLLWVGISRVAVGAHFPFDIAATWIMSFGITVLSMESARKLVGRPV